MVIKWIAQAKIVDGRLTVISGDGEIVHVHWIHNCREAKEGDWIMCVDDMRQMAVKKEIVEAIDAARTAGTALGLGKTVEWTSQAGGHTKTKRGVIVAVVPPRNSARVTCPPGTRVDTACNGRPEESYLVQVGKKRKLYWPLVNRLKVVSAEEEPRT